VTDTGWVSPGTMVASGSAYTNPDNAKVSDDVYATRVHSGGKESDANLIATGFGLAVPSDHIIVGVEVKVEGKKSGGVTVSRLSLTQNGAGPVGSNYSADVIFGATDTDSVAGGPADLWGLGTLTPAIVNASTFGVYFTTLCATSSTSYVDAISLKVYYEPDLSIEYEVDGLLELGVGVTGGPSNAYRRALRLVRSILPQRFSRRR
jgi:hypothetical protein